jgi:mRNA interferase MazF
MKSKVEEFVKWTKLKVRIHLNDNRLFFKEREVWWASIGMNIGFEQNGKNETFERPVLIIKKFNHDVMWVLPMTSKDKSKSNKYYYPVEYENEISYIILSQLRLVSSKRLLRKVRTLSKNEFKTVCKKIKNFL